MLVAIMIMTVLCTLFSMACAGHLANIEKLLKSLCEAKVAELNMFNGKE